MYLEAVRMVTAIYRHKALSSEVAADLLENMGSAASPFEGHGNAGTNSREYHYVTMDATQSVNATALSQRTCPSVKR